MAEISKDYKAAGGLTVKVISITKRFNGAGTAYYKITYTLKNNSLDKKILEGTFELLYKAKKDALQQYGFFDNIYPGESTNRSYEFKELESEEMSYLKYKPTNLNDSNVKTVLYWPIHSPTF